MALPRRGSRNSQGPIIAEKSSTGKIPPPPTIKRLYGFIFRCISGKWQCAFKLKIEKSSIFLVYPKKKVGSTRCFLQKGKNSIGNPKYSPIIERWWSLLVQLEKNHPVWRLAPRMFFGKGGRLRKKHQLYRSMFLLIRSFPLVKCHSFWFVFCEIPNGNFH